MSGHRGEVRSARFFPGGRIVVSAGDDGTLRVWDTESGREMGRWEGHERRSTASSSVPTAAMP